MSANYKKRAYKYFTVVEMLCVISITLILAGMLLPALSKARNKAGDAGCKSLMKQYGVATAMYADEYDGFFPDIRTYLSPALGFTGYFTYAQSGLPESLTRCPADRTTEDLNRLGLFLQESTAVKISIGGTCNLSDSQTNTSIGPRMMMQNCSDPQNAEPSKRCQWTDYQNQNSEKYISGAAISISKGYGTASDSLRELVFRHGRNSANAAFADGHAGGITLIPAIETANFGHDLKGIWTFPGNKTYPYGPRQGLPGEFTDACSVAVQ